MSNWDRIRSLAREFHQEVCAVGPDPQPAGISAENLLARAGQVTGFRTKGYRKGHPALQGALARFERNTILFDNTAPRWQALYHQAHEHAHIRLGHGARNCTAVEIDSEATEDKLPLGVQYVEGYGPQERIECEANVFAREFLLPGDLLRCWFLDEGLNAEEIALRVGGTLEMTDMVCHQLARALLTPEKVSAQLGQGSNSFVLDESQRAAAEADTGPLLIAAGPGTGKTRTLAGRVLYLLSLGILPEQILVLTFSNKAAAELRDRVKSVAPAESQKIKVETFHSFGLELLRKYGAKIGLPAKPTVLDPVDALFLLEQFLPQLGLDHYQNLYEPAIFLNDILKAISRAKDENVGPERYTELAQNMLAASTTDDEKVAAKALEVARVYAFYQTQLQSTGQLDFGDLICRSIELLQTHSQVRDEVQRTYQHVLVDEYQDVNRASGLLLKEIAGAGYGLWAVGDIRQSIHRWRGATTANMRLFAIDFPAAQQPLSLGRNYRSQPVIVNAFAALAPQMSATQGEPFVPWQKQRGDEDGAFKYEIAADDRAEAQGIARAIKENIQRGFAFRDHAIICRSHTSLARIAQYLEKEEVPALYLGDFFERPEVRDLLSLLALACQPDGRGLLRVARFPEYDIPLADVLQLHSLAREKGNPFPGALMLAAEAEGISARGKTQIALVAQHLENLCYGKSAWKTLTRYLFVRSRYLAPLLADSSVRSQQQRLALYQLLQFVHGQLNRKGRNNVDPKRELLAYIRRLEIFGEERQLRQVPAWADGIDAIRILTIHASKGLEFRAVFLPMLAKGYLPTSRGYEPCPPPPGLLSEQGADWQREEEECLFFVALSRARDQLWLSRPKRLGRVNKNPSDFLTLIEAQLPRAIEGAVNWPRNDAEHSDESKRCLPVNASPLLEQSEFGERELDVYLTCPRKYFYEFELGLSGKRDDFAYLQFHRCVYAVLRWLETARAEGQAIDEKATLRQLDETWQTKGPRDHFYADIYREKAEAMLRHALHRASATGAQSSQTTHQIKLANGTVRLTLDYTELHVDHSGSRLVLQRIRTGKPTKTESERPVYGLYHAAARQLHPHVQPQLQTLYLSTNEVRDITLTPQQLANRLKKYEEAIAGIRQRQFGAVQNERECPRCPHYFICPLAEES